MSAHSPQWWEARARRFELAAHRLGEEAETLWNRYAQVCAELQRARERISELERGDG